MARKSSDKPWLHGASGWWCTTIGGKRKKLDRDYKAACRKLKALRVQAKKGLVGNRDWWDAPFSDLADEYLDFIKAKKKPATYDNFRYAILRSLKIIGTGVRVCQLRKYHLERVDTKLQADGYSPTTIKNTITTVQGVLGWAVETERIDVHPVPKYKKPAARCRERVIVREEFAALLKHADRNFRRFLLALVSTGCRPGELRTLRWEWVDIREELWIIPEHKTITRQRNPKPRKIPLPPRILRMCRRLAQKPHQPGDHVFLNKHGRPYTKDGLVRKMARLRDEAGIEAKGGEKLVLHSGRHTFITFHVGQVSDVELADVTGHSDPRMLKRYYHSSPERLRDIGRRLRAPYSVPESASASGNRRLSDADAGKGNSADNSRPMNPPTLVQQEALTQAVS
jgi:integrase